MARAAFVRRCALRVALHTKIHCKPALMDPAARSGHRLMTGLARNVAMPVVCKDDIRRYAIDAYPLNGLRCGKLRMAGAACGRDRQCIQAFVAGGAFDLLLDVLTVRKIKRLPDLRRPAEINKSSG